MERLTVKSGFLKDHYVLKSMCNIDCEGGIDEEDICGHYCEMHSREDCSVECETCTIQKAFDKLAAYEETGYSPEDILQRLPKRRLVEKNPQLRAHWYIDPDGYYPVCSNCGCEPYNWIRPDHAEEDLKALESCPNCGAIMDPMHH